MKSSSYSRREFLATSIAAPLLIANLRPANGAGEVITFKSPNGQVQFVLFTTGPQFRYQITRASRLIVELSQFGLLLDGTDLCRDSTISRIERYRISEEYSTRGFHSSVVNNCRGARISIRHQA